MTFALPELRSSLDASASMVVFVEPAYQAHLAAAITRLGYLYPDARFTATPDGVLVETPHIDEPLMRREVLHAVYRERIFAETLPLRRTLIDGLLAR